MHRVYIGLGGNIGNSIEILQKALNLLSRLKIKNFQHSHFYRSTPVGGIEQADFINAACVFETEIQPDELLKILQKIESDLGKRVLIKNGPRTIDLDLLFYGNLIVENKNLIIPHPRWNERLFVLLPLLDLTQSINEHNLLELYKNFKNINEEKVVKLAEQKALPTINQS